MTQTTGRTESAKWELLEILAAVILAAESLRVGGSVVAGIVDAFSTHVSGLGQQRTIGGALQTAANFADGPGVILLLISLGLLWWRVEYWTGQVRTAPPAGDGGSRSPAESIQLRRLHSLTRWITGIFALAAAGTLSFFVGNVLVNTAGGVTTGTQWLAYANDTFSIAYLVIASGGLIASLRLAKQCELDLDLIRGTS